MDSARIDRNSGNSAGIHRNSQELTEILRIKVIIVTLWIYLDSILAVVKGTCFIILFTS